MRPHDRKRRAQRVDMARVRMLVKNNLGFMPGFPVDVRLRSKVVRWQPIASEEPIDLDRSHLRRASYAISKLNGSYRAAFQRVIDDHDRFERATRSIVDALKPTLHHGDKIPRSLFAASGAFSDRLRRRAKRLIVAHPFLQSSVAAASWITCGREDQARLALDWFEQNAEALRVLTRELGVRCDRVVVALLAMTRRQGAKRIAPLMRMLSDIRVYQTPVHHKKETLGKAISVISKHSLQRAAELEEPFGTPIGAALADYALWLSHQPATAQRRSLALLELTWPETTLAKWQLWNDKVGRLYNDIEVAMATGPGDDLGVRRRKQLKKRLEALKNHTPPPIHVAGWLWGVKTAVDPDIERHARKLSSALAKLPLVVNDIPVRAAMLEDWVRLAQSSKTLRVFELVAHIKQLAKHPQFAPQWLMLWLRDYHEYKKRNWRHNLHDELLEELPSGKLLRLWFAAFARLCQYTTTLDEMGRLMALIQVTGDAEASARCAAVLLDKVDDYVPPRLLAAAAIVCEGDPNVMVSVIHAWRGRPEEEYSIDDAGLESIAKLFADSGASVTLRTLIPHGHMTRLVRYGTHLRLARRGMSRIPRPGSPQSDRQPTWARRFPREFQPALRRLDAAHPAAERAAAKMLRKDFPAPEVLERQVTALVTKRDQASGKRRDELTSRLRVLRAKLREPVTASPARMARLLSRLEQAAALAHFDQWAVRFDAYLADELPKALGLSSRPLWLLEPLVLELLLGLLELPSADRALALRLLRARDGAPPWDLRDAPANRRYLERLALGGIDGKIWLEPNEMIWKPPDDRPPLTMALADDPLHVFAMGLHFQTCLRPGAMNFYSVIANAADINKRVLYARSHKGTVVGRCLLALTQSGQVLAFEPYCHDGNLDFDSIARHYAINLANRMGTTVAVGGEVPTLVANRWYDDGSIDLAGQFAALTHGSKFRASLSKIDLDAFLPALENAFAPHGLTGHTLGVAISLDEMAERPALILPLVPLLDHAEDLLDDHRMRAARLAVDAGSLQAARRLAGDRLVPILLHSERTRDWLQADALEVLLALDPSAMIRVIRQTRAKSVRSWADEYRTDRVFGAARAMDALVRPKQAADLYARVLKLSSTEETKQHCRKRIRELAT